ERGVVEDVPVNEVDLLEVVILVEQDVEDAHVVLLGCQRVDERAADVACTADDENVHGPSIATCRDAPGGARTSSAGVGVILVGCRRTALVLPPSCPRASAGRSGTTSRSDVHMPTG